MKLPKIFSSLITETAWLGIFFGKVFLAIGGVLLFCLLLAGIDYVSPSIPAKPILVWFVAILGWIWETIWGLISNWQFWVTAWAVTVLLLLRSISDKLSFLIYTLRKNNRE